MIGFNCGLGYPTPQLTAVSRVARRTHPTLDQPCPFRLTVEKEVVARVGGGSVGAAEVWGEARGCKSVRSGKVAGIRLERRDDFARVGTG